MVLAAQEAVRRKDDGSGGEIPCELLEEKDSKKKMMMMKRAKLLSDQEYDEICKC